MEYVRLSENYYNNILIPASESPYKYVKDDKKPYFISMMKYSQKQFQEWKKTGTLKGVGGSTTDRLWADFDSKNLRDAFEDSKVFHQRLLGLGLNQENIQISFSGNKGVGFIVDVDDELNVNEVKDVCFSLADGLKTFDTTMYDNQKIFRLTFTTNEKSGLYKIPLTEEQLINYDLDTIIEQAKSIDDLDQEEVRKYYKRFKPTAKYLELKAKVIQPEAKEETAEVVAVPKDWDLEKALETKPRHWKDYKYALLQGYFEEGERHSALMVIAATCRGLGYDRETTIKICESAIEKQASRTGQDEFDKGELVENIIDESVFSKDWQGGQYSPQSNPWLKTYCERMGFKVEKEKDNSVKRIQDIEGEFLHYIEHIEENTIKIGIPVLDKNIPLTIGMNLGIVGAASSGKTALALEILKNTSKSGVVSVFASLDMHRNRLFEKLLYKTTNYTKDELHEKIKAGEMPEIIKKIKEDYGNVWFYDRSCPTVEDIRSYIEEVERETGQKVKLVMLDYFERVNADKTEDTAASKEVSGKLQDLVNDLNICLITLVQPNKFSLASGPDSPITSYTAIKGSSFLYQSFRGIIAIWRPFFNPMHSMNDKYMQIALLKNDFGEVNVFDFAWNGRRGEIREMTEEEHGEFEYLLNQKNKKEPDDKGGWS